MTVWFWGFIWQINATSPGNVKCSNQCRLQNTLDMQKSYLRRNSTDFTVQKPERTQKALFCRIDSSLAVRIVIAYLTFLHGELLLWIFENEKIAVSSDLDSPWRSSDAEHFIREQKTYWKAVIYWMNSHIMSKWLPLNWHLVSNITI